MKTLIAAIGAMALATGVAEAQPHARRAAVDRAPAVGATYDVGGGSQTNNTSARSWTVNQGAGTSRSSDANQG